MGEVYLADHPRLPRRDALKVLRGDVTDDGEYRERFIREAELAATLSHPSIVKVHDTGEFEGQLWISTEYVEGADAAGLMRSIYPSGMPIDEATAVVSAIAGALDYAHDRGLLHRDVKPANILVGARGSSGLRHYFLADFGIARSIADPNGLTATNMTVGTLAYAAPEQLLGEKLDGRADQYALAASAFHLLAGAPPFDAINPTVVIGKHLTAPVPMLSERRSDLGHLDAVFEQALAKNPLDRFKSCSDFAAALAGDGFPRDTRPRSTVAAIPQGAGTTAAAIPQPEPVPKTGKLNVRVGAVLSGAVVVVIALVAAGVIFSRSDSGDTPSMQSTRVAASSSRSAAPAPPISVDGQSALSSPGNEYKVETSFSQIGDSLSVVLRNPNTDVGLIRSTFELAVIDDAGSVIGIEGQGGLVGTRASTIYQLPPGGTFGLSDISVPAGKTVGSLELTVTGRWFQWDTVHSATAVVSEQRLSADSTRPNVTGRVTLDGDNPLNVIVMSFVRLPAGTVVGYTVVDCVQPGQSRAFEATSFTDAAGPYELENIVAYPTAVIGAGPQYPVC